MDSRLDLLLDVILASSSWSSDGTDTGRDGSTDTELLFSSSGAAKRISRQFFSSSETLSPSTRAFPCNVLRRLPPCCPRFRGMGIAVDASNEATGAGISGGDPAVRGAACHSSPIMVNGWRFALLAGLGDDRKRGLLRLELLERGVEGMVTWHDQGQQRGVTDHVKRGSDGAETS